MKQEPRSSAEGEKGAGGWVFEKSRAEEVAAIPEESKLARKTHGLAGQHCRPV